ncbi:hypothetical protein Emed_003841 [Eimeria media]
MFEESCVYKTPFKPSPIIQVLFLANLLLHAAFRPTGSGPLTHPGLLSAPETPAKTKGHRFSLSAAWGPPSLPPPQGASACRRMLSDAGSSSGSEAAADLVDSLLGGGGPPASRRGAPPEGPREKAHKRGPQSKVKTEEGAPPVSSEAASVSEPAQGLKLELKGLPLEVSPQGDGGAECLRLEPHQKILRLSVEGDPNADPTALLAAYLASFEGGVQPSEVLAEKHIHVKGAWYSVQREACRGELLLGPTPTDTQLLTPERHLGHLTFSRCEPPQANAKQETTEEDRTWETGPSFARFHKLQHYGANVKPKKPKSRRS